MNVAVLACLTPATGNAVTAERIARHLATEHQVTLLDTCLVRSMADLEQTLRRDHVDVAVGVHALLSGALLARLPQPFGLVFGGTDLYQPVHPLQQRQMDCAVESARGVVAFSAENLARAEARWPTVRGKACLIPQGVQPCEPSDYSLRRELGLRHGDVLLLLPASLRGVKDPGFLLDAVEAWHHADRRIHLALVGAALDPDHAEEVLGRVRGRPGLHYLPPIPRPHMQQAMREADLVLNSSTSEGMCGTLLEAMQQGTPVIARRNEGNSTLVRSGETGLLYDTPEEFVALANGLLERPLEARRLAEAAQSQVALGHGIESERDGYLRWVNQLLPGRVPHAVPDGSRHVPDPAARPERARGHRDAGRDWRGDLGAGRRG